MDLFGKFVNKIGKLSIHLVNAICPYHQSECDKPCHLQTEETDGFDTIYGVQCNYIVPKTKYYCSAHKGKKYSILTARDTLKFIQNGFKESFIKLNDQFIFIIGSSNNHTYILSELISFINSSVLSGECKTIGLIRKQIIANFKMIIDHQIFIGAVSTQLAATNILQIVDKFVVSAKVLDFIWNFLWINSYSHFIGMYFVLFYIYFDIHLVLFTSISLFFLLFCHIYNKFD